MLVNAVVDYIFSSETATTVIGEKLKQAAVIKNKPSSKTKQKEDDYQVLVQDICSYDSNDCLCWIDYRSWMTMPKRLQESIQELLNPKIWRGMIFQYDQWNVHEQAILTNMNQNIMLILTVDQKKYHIYTIPLYKCYLDWMSQVRFKELSQKLNKTAIKVYGRSHNKIHILDNNNNKEEFSLTPN